MIVKMIAVAVVGDVNIRKNLNVHKMSFVNKHLDNSFVLQQHVINDNVVLISMLGNNNPGTCFSLYFLKESIIL